MKQQQVHPIKRRANLPANSQNFGHSAGLHGEDQPYMSDDLIEDDSYGMPRTYQTDAIVYPSDTLDHPSHYIFLNLNGTIVVVEFPHDDPTHARMYKNSALLSDNAGFTPVTGEFKQINGKVEMIVHVGDQQIMYLNDGTQFKPQQ